MISLTIENRKVEKIFLEDFGSDKAVFFQFIIDSFERQRILKSFDKSCKQAVLQQKGELTETSLQDLINEL